MAILTEADRHSPVWLKLEKYLEDELRKARLRNDGDLNSEETARLRGKISMLKVLLDLDKQGPAIEVDAGE